MPQKWRRARFRKCPRITLHLAWLVTAGVHVPNKGMLQMLYSATCGAHMPGTRAESQVIVG